MAEREVRLILLLNVFQSVDESAHVVVALASARERTCPERESPFVTASVNASCDCASRSATRTERVSTVHERVERTFEIVFKFPERVRISSVL